MGCHPNPFSNALLEFRRRARQVMNQHPETQDGPVIVHCNDGAGRSGVYIAIDANIELCEEDGVFDVYGYLKKMRGLRRGLVETLDQYKSVLTAVNKTQDGHPFKQFLDVDVTLPADKISSLTDGFFPKLNALLLKLKSILLVQNVVETLKFAVVMYLLTYLGAIMNGLTIITLGWIGVFSVPRIYRDNQKQIDDAILPLKAKLDDLQAKMTAALPASIVGKKDV